MLLYICSEDLPPPDWVIICMLAITPYEWSLQHCGMRLRPIKSLIWPLQTVMMAVFTDESQNIQNLTGPIDDGYIANAVGSIGSDPYCCEGPEPLDDGNSALYACPLYISKYMVQMAPVVLAAVLTLFASFQLLKLSASGLSHCLCRCTWPWSACTDKTCCVAGCVPGYMLGYIAA